MLTLRKLAIGIAAGTLAALIAAGRLELRAATPPLEMQPASDSHLKRSVAVILTGPIRGLSGADALRARQWITGTLEAALAGEPGLLIVKKPRSADAAQFRAEVELAQAAHFRAAGGWRAGAACYVRLVDTASGAELASERFTGTAPAQGAAADVWKRLGQPSTPVTTAAAGALRKASAYLAAQIRPRFWQTRVVAVRPADEAERKESTRPIVTLAAGADVGLRPEDGLQLLRYGAPIEGLDGKPVGRHLAKEPPLPLYVRSVERETAAARVRSDLEPKVGDIVRWGEVILAKAIVGTFATDPPDARRRGDRDLDVVAGQVQEALSGLVQYFEREQLQATPNSFICSGEVKRSGAAKGEITIRVTVDDKRPGKQRQTATRTGPQELQASLVNQLWLELQDKLQGAVASAPSVEPDKLSQVDPGRIQLIKELTSVRFHRERPDFHLKIGLDRGEGAIYRYGDGLRLTLESPDTDCYVQLWYVNNENRSYQVFPRDPKQPGHDPLRNDPKQGLLRKGEVRSLPPAGSKYPVGAPAGEDYMVAIALRGPKAKQLYPYLAGLMQEDYPPQEETDRSDVKLPPVPVNTSPTPRSRGLRVVDAMEQDERKVLQVKNSATPAQEPAVVWDGENSWATNATWWRTVDPHPSVFRPRRRPRTRSAVVPRATAMAVREGR